VRTRMRRDPKLLALHRGQLDARKEPRPHHESPTDGWVRSIRTALGMSAAQLAKRLGVTQQAIANIERNERSGGISLATLSKVATALDCELMVEFRPKTTLEDTMRRQATAKARAEHNRVVLTMRLEAQEDGVEHALDLDEAARQWMTTRIAKLWD
jgi:predicted DNA-binding mobile mystery protein A